MNCPSCATPSTYPGQRYCARCGAELPVAAARTGRRALPVLAALGLVAVLGVAGAVLLFGGDDPAGDADADAPSTLSASSTPAAGDTTASATVPPTTATSRPAEPRTSAKDRPPRSKGPTQAAAAAYRCWDGSGAADADGCDDPTGLKGLRWVFPGAADPVCDRAPQPGRLASIDCRFTTSSGGVVAVHYTEWATWSEGHRHYEDQEVRKESRWQGMLRWNVAAVSPNPPFKTALMYPDAPWSVTVYGYTAGDRNEVLDQLEWRSPGDLRGVSLR